MKRIFLIISIFLPLVCFSQIDTTVTSKYVKVININDVIAVNDYFGSARLETEQTTSIGETIGDISLTGLPDLPTFGEWVEKDKIYNYDGTVVHCIQAHSRTVYEPSDTPALFATYRTNSDTLSWIANEKVVVGWKRVYLENTYECLQSHMTQTSWNPVATIGVLWTLIPETNEWQVGVAYKVNDLVTYQGSTYKCLQAHTSQTGWQPPNVPALWQLQ